MASSFPPLPPARSASRSRGITRSPNPSRRDKVRQGKLIRCWTDEEEEFLFRSRSQGQKLSYKNIANRLNKSELACRLHYHHMTVGRKDHGQRAEGTDEDILSETSDGSSPSRVPLRGIPPAAGGFDDAQQHRDLYAAAPPVPGQLPGFDTFLRVTFHQRSTSMPGSLSEDDTQDLATEQHLQHNTRPGRTFSGTWLREPRSMEAYLQPHLQRSASDVNTFRTLPVPSPYSPETITTSRLHPQAHGSSH